MRWLPVLITVVAFALAAPASADAPALQVQPAPAGAAGGPVVSCLNCDMTRMSNIQGGWCESNGACQPNLDIGAGSDGVQGPRGRLSMCFDICSSAVIFDGHKNPLVVADQTGVVTLYGGSRPLVRTGPSGILLYAMPRVRCHGRWQPMSSCQNGRAARPSGTRSQPGR